MPVTADPTRRLFLGGLLAAPALLSGCKVLDGLSRVDHPVRNLMEGTNRLTHRTQKLLAGDAFAPRNTRGPTSARGLRPNGTDSAAGRGLPGFAANGFADWRLTVSGSWSGRWSLSLSDLMAMPSRTQITRHDCVEGWSCIAEWTGVHCSHVLGLAGSSPEGASSTSAPWTRWSAALRSREVLGKPRPAGQPASQTILAYGMNGRGASPCRNGAPCGCRVERQLGYKMAKYLQAIEVVPELPTAASYWAERGYDWYAGI
jgi:DMSO/TMAO reductase YedYZ molybdopterin-dependent catalytic subunit